MELIKRILILAVTSFIIVTACKDDDFEYTPVLEVEKSELIFDKNGNQTKIGVRVNNNDEVYFVVSPQAREWLDATVDESQTEITVEVKENITAKDREGHIDVMSRKGSETHTIKVKQSGLLEILLIPESIKLNFAEHNAIEVRVEGNFNDPIGEPVVNFLTTGQPQWITIKKEVNANKFFIDVKENEDTQDRLAEIVINVDGTDKILNLSQEGYFTFQLPYVNFGYDYQNNRYAFPDNILDVNEFELARGSQFTASQHNVAYIYNTVSDYIPQIYYMTEQSKFTLMRVIEENVAREISRYENEYYRKYMEGIGFEVVYHDEIIDGENNAVILWNKERMLAALHMPLFNKVSFVHSRYKPHHHLKGQIFDLKTFDQMPYPFTDFGSSLSEVQKWESAQESKPLDEGPTIWTFTPNASKDESLERAYYFDESGKLYQVLVLFENLELGMYPYPEDVGNAIYFNVTKEMTALLQSEGYKPVIVGNDAVRFVNENKQQMIDVRVQGFASEDMLPRLVLLFAPYSN